jgi:uncharacterized protein YjbI with pentapeptide repeats
VLKNVDLSGALANQSVWNDAHLQKVNFSRAALRYAHFEHAYGRRLNFSRADLSYGSWHDVRFRWVKLFLSRRKRLRGTSQTRLLAERRALARS